MKGKTKVPVGIVISSVLMVLFGLAEVVTSFTHKFFLLSVSTQTVFTIAGAAIGLCYVASGLLILTMKRKCAGAAIGLLILDVAGRIALTVSGLYPTDSVTQVIGIVAGTAIAVAFAVYIGIRWKAFR